MPSRDEVTDRQNRKRENFQIIGLLLLFGALSFTRCEAICSNGQQAMNGQDSLRQDPWVPTMERAGIKRARAVLEFDWDGRPTNITVVKVLYFSKYDNDCAQITNPSRLEEIRASGLEKQIKRYATASEEITKWRSIEGMGNAKKGTITINFLADPWPPPPAEPKFMSPIPSKYEKPLPNVTLGDEISISEFVASKPSKNLLDFALRMAASDDDSCVINMLVKAGADVNPDTGQGNTPLMNASAVGAVHSTKALLEAGADPSRANIEGRTALWFAERDKHTAIIEMLKEAGAKR